jgi:DNA-binding transcriptional ArsR family regulator
MAMSGLENELLALLRKEAVTPDEAAKRLGVSWATANGHLLKLVGEGKAILVRKGRVNVYQARAPSIQVFQVPNWIKPAPLEVLSDELARYFSRSVTAAQMIEKERRKA